ncbi:tryptophan-rich sensory protein [Candidatus Aerophobetes bacterium]|nr:tryptophan-rich sensory protein [Candidatus Aerophobetes bacterium]
MKNYQKLVVSILIPLVIGVLGSIFTSSSVNSWYLSLNKPFFNPPNFLFAFVWTTLFVLIGISFYLVWKNNFGNHKNMAIGVYSVQLFLNLLWSFLFFGLKTPFFALIEIILLWVVILTNIVVFHRISKPAGFLLIPYLVWVSFAAFLNYFIFILN